MKKKVLSVFLTVLIIMQTLVLGSISAYAKTDESFEGYTAISTPQELYDIRNNPSGKYYLANDIIFDAADYEEGGDFYNYGKCWKPIDEFSGILDGRNHKIETIKITSEFLDRSSGFIKYNSGIVKNLTIDINLNAKLGPENTTSNFYGSICCKNVGIVQNCSATGSMNFNEENITKGGRWIGTIGGICGSSTNAIYFCKSNVDITINCVYVESENFLKCNTVNAGGICGSSEGSIFDCYNEGNITKSLAAVSGSTCYDNVGSIYGSGYGKVERCYNVGNVKLGAEAQDIHGQFNYADCNNCYSDCEGMKNQKTYIGWNFLSVWQIEEGIDYPKLRENPTYFSGGEGTQDDPYVVTTVNQLFSINDFMSSSFILGNDIVVNETDYPAGIMPSFPSSSEGIFRGIFDGNNHTITVKKLLEYGDARIGLPFAYTNSGTIKNLKMNFDCSQDITASKGYAGAIIGAFCKTNHRTIENCSLSGNINIEANVGFTVQFGGFSAINSGTIVNCDNNCNTQLNVTGDQLIYGGITAYNYSLIDSCNFSGNSELYFARTDTSKDAQNCIVGGISGYNVFKEQNPLIEKCCFDGNILLYSEQKESETSSNYLGGITGYNRYDSNNSSSKTDEIIIRNCMSVGNLLLAGNNELYNFSAVGGITAYESYNSKSQNGYLSISECYSSVSIACQGIGAYFNYIIGCKKHSDYPAVNCYCVDTELNYVPDENSDEYKNNCIKTVDEMKRQETYAGFDFENIWEMNKYDGFYYPTLRCMDKEPDNKILSISVSKLPDKQTFTVGEGIDLTGLEVKSLTNGGQLTDISNYKCFYDNSVTYGDKNVVILWSDNNDLMNKILACSDLDDLLALETQENLNDNLFFTYFAINIEPKPVKNTVSYNTHIQDIGWNDYVKDGEGSGTVGLCKRLEGIHIKVDGEYDLGVKYCTHVQDYGWQDFVADDEMSGTSGQSKRLEAIKIELTGADAQYFDIYYRVHVQDYGWLDWAKNGEAAGTEGLSKRLESIEIKIVAKNTGDFQTTSPFISKYGLISYQTHIQDIGWQDCMKDGELSGTSGQSKRLEGIKINLNSNLPEGDIYYTTHVQDYGWLDWSSNGELSGTTGEGKRLEAIAIELDGEINEKYDVYYRVHVQDFGWLGWARNGEISGTSGLGYRLEAIEIKLVPKGETVQGYGDYSYIYA